MPSRSNADDAKRQLIKQFYFAALEQASRRRQALTISVEDIAVAALLVTNRAHQGGQPVKEVPELSVDSRGGDAGYNWSRQAFTLARQILDLWDSGDEDELQTRLSRIAQLRSSHGLGKPIESDFQWSRKAMLTVATRSDIATTEAGHAQAEGNDQ